MNPLYPVYIISKGRWESRLTARALLAMSVPFHIVIEPQEYDQYAAVIPKDMIYVLPFSNLGQGSIPARNWVWEHSISIGAERHWILDDNISHFSRFNNNQRIQVADGTIFRIAEKFIDRYENIAHAGFQYDFFIPRKYIFPPMLLNTRIYSCMIIKNDVPFRWRGKYNEDTDLSLRMLKAGYCTVLFNAFLAGKQATMTMKGGNTEDLYKIKDGRLLMAQSLQEQHPDVVKIINKWGRYQHWVDYSPYKKNKFILKKDVAIKTGINNYGMEIVNNAHAGHK
jgi:hypothetical protein